SQALQYVLTSSRARSFSLSLSAAYKGEKDFLAIHASMHQLASEAEDDEARNERRREKKAHRRERKKEEKEKRSKKKHKRKRSDSDRKERKRSRRRGSPSRQHAGAIVVTVQRSSGKEDRGGSSSETNLSESDDGDQNRCSSYAVLEQSAGYAMVPLAAPPSLEPPLPFSTDRRGDKEALMCGAPYRLDVSTYHSTRRAGLGRPRPHRRRYDDDGGGDESTRQGHKGRREAPQRYFEADARRAEDTMPLRCWRLCRSEKRAARAAAALTRRTRDDEERADIAASPPPSFNFIPVDPVMVGGEAGATTTVCQTGNDGSGDKEEDDGGGTGGAVESLEQSIVRRTKELNRATRDSPHDVRKWLRFVDFQAEAVAMFRRRGRDARDHSIWGFRSGLATGGSAMAAAVHDMQGRQLAVLGRALKANAGHLRLILERLSAARLCLASEEAEHMWCTALADAAAASKAAARNRTAAAIPAAAGPGGVAGRSTLWRYYVAHRRSLFANFSLTAARKVVADAAVAVEDAEAARRAAEEAEDRRKGVFVIRGAGSALSGGRGGGSIGVGGDGGGGGSSNGSGAVAVTELALLQIQWEHLLLERSAGWEQRAVAAAQATVEGAAASPALAVAAAGDDALVLRLVAAFWESEFARIGDAHPASAGMASWRTQEGAETTAALLAAPAPSLQRPPFSQDGARRRRLSRWETQPEASASWPRLPPPEEESSLPQEQQQPLLPWEQPPPPPLRPLLHAMVSEASGVSGSSSSAVKRSASLVLWRRRASDFFFANEAEEPPSYYSAAPPLPLQQQPPQQQPLRRQAQEPPQLSPQLASPTPPPPPPPVSSSELSEVRPMSQGVAALERAYQAAMRATEVAERLDALADATAEEDVAKAEDDEPSGLDELLEESPTDAEMTGRRQDFMGEAVEMQASTAESAAATAAAAGAAAAAATAVTATAATEAWAAGGVGGERRYVADAEGLSNFDTVTGTAYSVHHGYRIRLEEEDADSRGSAYHRILSKLAPAAATEAAAAAVAGKPGAPIAPAAPRRPWAEKFQRRRAARELAEKAVLTVVAPDDALAAWSTAEDTLGRERWAPIRAVSAPEAADLNPDRVVFWDDVREFVPAVVCPAARRLAVAQLLTLAGIALPRSAPSHCPAARASAQLCDSLGLGGPVDVLVGGLRLKGLLNGICGGALAARPPPVAAATTGAVADIAAGDPFEGPLWALRAVDQCVLLSEEFLADSSRQRFARNILHTLLADVSGVAGPAGAGADTDRSGDGTMMTGAADRELRVQLQCVLMHMEGHIAATAAATSKGHNGRRETPALDAAAAAAAAEGVRSVAKSVLQASEQSATDLRLWSAYVHVETVQGCRAEALRVARKALSMAAALPA
ncbi:unnamed protein product, partial [Phaeothamnion confervicola]